MLDTQSYDEDADAAVGAVFDEESEDDSAGPALPMRLRTEQDFRLSAAQIYRNFDARYHNRFRWVGRHLFVDALYEHLLADATALRAILDRLG